MSNKNKYRVCNVSGAGECVVNLADNTIVDTIENLVEYRKSQANLIKAEQKLYAEIESEIEFLRELREDSHTEYQITLLDEKIECKQILLAEARGEK